MDSIALPERRSKGTWCLVVVNSWTAGERACASGFVGTGLPSHVAERSLSLSCGGFVTVATHEEFEADAEGG